MANTKPWQEEQVAPGLGKGASKEGSNVRRIPSFLKKSRLRASKKE